MLLDRLNFELVRIYSSSRGYLIVHLVHLESVIRRLFASLSLFLAVLLSPIAHAQGAELADSVDAFVPPGWRIEHQVLGQVDADRIPDAVLILRQTDPQKILRGEFLPEGVEVDVNPRMILVLRHTRRGYQVIARNDRLIPAPDSELIIDPLDYIRIEHRKVILQISYFATMGSWTASTTRFIFRLDEACLHLTRYEDVAFHRAGPDETRKVIDYVFREGVEPPIKTGRMKPVPGPCIETLGDAWETNW